MSKDQNQDLSKSHIEIITDEGQAAQLAKDIIDKSIPFEIQPSSTLPIISGIDAIIVISDSNFPFVGNDPILPGQGFSWNYRVNTFLGHIIMDVVLTDDDKTGNKREFKLVFCPNEYNHPDRIEYKDIHDLVEKMAEYGRNQKRVRIALVGRYSFEVYTKRPIETYTEIEKNPNLMCHIVIGRARTSLVTLDKVKGMLVYRGTGSDDKNMMARHCHYCKDEGN